MIKVMKYLPLDALTMIAKEYPKVCSKNKYGKEVRKC
jgi:hypothetical protein